jgi:quercetin dioxygenase-like cupin family protein
MKTARLEDFTGGWFVGDFEPVLHATPEVEVAVKYYRAGDHEKAHVHKVAREITVIVSGRVRMCEDEFSAGDIIVLEPGDATGFEAMTDAATAVVKLPSVKGDKYPCPS